MKVWENQSFRLPSSLDFFSKYLFIQVWDLCLMICMWMAKPFLHAKLNTKWVLPWNLLLHSILWGTTLLSSWPQITDAYNTGTRTQSQVDPWTEFGDLHVLVGELFRQSKSTHQLASSLATRAGRRRTTCLCTDEPGSTKGWVRGSTCLQLIFPLRRRLVLLLSSIMSTGRWAVVLAYIFCLSFLLIPLFHICSVELRDGFTWSPRNGLWTENGSLEILTGLSISSKVCVQCFGVREEAWIAAIDWGYVMHRTYCSIWIYHIHPWVQNMF